MEGGYVARDDGARDARHAIEGGAAAAAGTDQMKRGSDPWKHRSDGMRCKTCMWFASKEPVGPLSTERQQQVGRCRRHAPTMGGYPVVFMADWCGDHRLDENKA